jgi:hypothetical protein
MKFRLPARAKAIAAVPLAGSYRRYWVPLLMAIGAIAGCNRTLDPGLSDKGLFPIQDGKHRTYYIEDTTYQLSQGPSDIDTVVNRFQRRQLVNGTSTDQTRELDRLELYTAPVDSGSTERDSSFSFERLWTLYKDNEFAERIEGNTRYQVLYFPVREGATWNGNAFNGQDAQDYTYITTDTTVTVQGKTYENCTMVRHERTTSAITNIDIYEIYAPNIGLIKRYDKVIKYELEGNDSRQLSTDSRITRQELIDQSYQ